MDDNKNKPIPVYKAYKPYIFATFASDDMDRVFPDIRLFQDMGYNIFYDEKGCGHRCLEFDRSALIVVFITKNSSESKFINEVIEFSMKSSKNILEIYLDEIDCGNWGYELSKIQSIFKSNLHEKEYVFKFKVACEDFRIRPIIKTDKDSFDDDFTFDSKIIFRNVERLARQMNENFDESRPELVMSCINKAKSIYSGLFYMGYDVVNICDKKDSFRKEIKALNQIEIEKLAEIIHINWCREKFGLGWKYGLEDDEDYISPYLVSWNELSDDIKRECIDFAATIPDLIKSIGLKIVFSGLSLLTFAICEFYETGCLDSDGINRFNSLDDYNKNHFYQKVKSLVKVLNEYDFKLEPLSLQSCSLREFNDRQMDLFSDRLHEEWCEYMYHQGWNYGCQFDRKNKTHPYLLPSFLLDSSVVYEEYGRILKNLPFLCNESGLKIVDKSFNE